jgi:hypothetical protein
VKKFFRTPEVRNKRIPFINDPVLIVDADSALKITFLAQAYF